MIAAATLGVLLVAVNGLLHSQQVGAALNFTVSWTPRAQDIDICVSATSKNFTTATWIGFGVSPPNAKQMQNADLVVGSTASPPRTMFSDAPHGRPSGVSRLNISAASFKMELPLVTMCFTRPISSGFAAITNNQRVLWAVGTMTNGVPGYHGSDQPDASGKTQTHRSDDTPRIDFLRGLSNSTASNSTASNSTASNSTLKSTAVSNVPRSSAPELAAAGAADEAPTTRLARVAVASPPASTDSYVAGSTGVSTDAKNGSASTHALYADSFVQATWPEELVIVGGKQGLYHGYGYAAPNISFNYTYNPYQYSPSTTQFFPSFPSVSQPLLRAPLTTTDPTLFGAGVSSWPANPQNWDSFGQKMASVGTSSPSLFPASTTFSSLPSTTFPSTTFPSTTFPSTTFPSTTFPSTTFPSTTFPSTTFDSATSFSNLFSNPFSSPLSNPVGAFAPSSSFSFDGSFASNGALMNPAPAAWPLTDSSSLPADFSQAWNPASSSWPSSFSTGSATSSDPAAWSASQWSSSDPSSSASNSAPSAWSSSSDGSSPSAWSSSSSSRSSPDWADSFAARGSSNSGASSSSASFASRRVPPPSSSWSDSFATQLPSSASFSASAAAALMNPSSLGSDPTPSAWSNPNSWTPADQHSFGN